VEILKKKIIQSIAIIGSVSCINSMDLLEADAESTNTSQPKVLVSYEGHYISTGNGVRIRSGAGTNYSILGSVNKNAKLDVKSFSNDWYKIIYKGRIGYISGNYVQKQKNNEDEKPLINRINYSVTGNRVNIRTGGGTNYNIIGSATKKQKVEVISTSNGWHKINYKGKIAYISAAYTEKESEHSTVTTSNEQNMISFAKQFLGVPYKWAGVSPTGFDCSGFIYYVLKENGMPYGRTNVSGYWYNNTSFQKVTNSKPGDLIFFQNTYTYGPSHIGIMLNKNEFIQAGSSTGVTISNINDSYWKKHFLGYKRIKS